MSLKKELQPLVKSYQESSIFVKHLSAARLSPRSFSRLTKPLRQLLGSKFEPLELPGIRLFHKAKMIPIGIFHEISGLGVGSDVLLMPNQIQRYLERRVSMKTLTMTIVALGVLLSAHLLCAQESQTESFYRDSIDKFIAKYEHQASMIGSKSNSIRQDAAVASIKASYYKAHKEQLIDDMFAQNLEAKRGKVDYFLVKSFYDFCETDLARSLADRFQLMTSEKRSRMASGAGMKDTESVR